MNPALSEIDVCIVGGGISGLTAAYKILSKESTLNLIILESGVSIGGELYHSPLGELGGKWITPDQYHIYDLCRKLNVPVTRRESPEKHVHFYWAVNKGLFSVLARFEVHRFIYEIDLKAKYYRPGSFKLSRNDIKMEKFLAAKLFFEQSRQFIRCFVRFISGVEATDISYNEFMSICQGCGGLSELIALFTGTSSMTLEFSSQRLLFALEKEINSHYIFLKTKVIEVIHYVNYALVRDDRNNVFRTSILIMAVPWQIVQQIIFYPPIPQELRIPIFEDKYMITSFLSEYRESFWRNAGYSGSLILHNPHMICYEYQQSVYGGMVVHDEGFNQILQPVILKRLSDIYGVEMGFPIVWQQRTWEQSTILNLPTTTPWNQIIWASTTAATLYRGCLSGAVQSGYRAAFHALLTLRPQTISWQDVDEIQKASAVRRRYSWFTLVFSSLNLYNSTYYVFLLGVLYVTYKLVKAKKNELF